MDRLKTLIGITARTLCAAALIPLAPTAVTAQDDDPVWPIADGSTNVMTGFQSPEATLRYFHEGLDLGSTRQEVVAMRSGVVSFHESRFVGGTMVVQVQVGDRIDADLYAHVLLDPWNVGDAIEAGDTIGVISDTYFDNPRFGPLADHVHLTRYRDYTGGTGIILRPPLPNILHPLDIFARPRYRDPQLSPAEPEDGNNDGWVFAISRSGAKYNFITNAFGSVDLLVEATDRQSQTLVYNQCIVGIGYWIESLCGGDHVRGPEAPYRLMRINEEWRPSVYDADALLPSIVLTRGRYILSQGSTVTGFPQLGTYIVTNTRGTTGRASEVDAEQYWRTDARVGTGTEPNGKGAMLALDIHEARFPDGRYRVHALVEDLIAETDTAFDLLVDNFRPYVEAVRVQRHDTREVLYDGRWHFDETDRLLRFRERSIPGPVSISRPDGSEGDGVLIEIEFSEEMSDAAIVAIEPAIGFVPVLTPKRGNARRWSGRIPRAALGPVNDQTRYQLQISGADLAGTTLFPLGTSSDKVLPIGKRSSANPTNNATLDTVHAVPLRAGAAHD